jgi:thiol-disulfide isomerase/thioredoxin
LRNESLPFSLLLTSCFPAGKPRFAFPRFLQCAAVAPLPRKAFTAERNSSAKLWYILPMAARIIILRATLPAVLILTAISLLAVPKGKEPAPRFNATTTSGEKFTNDSIKGKVVLLEFWTTWCGYCADEAGFVDKIGHDFADKGLILLAIDVGESKKTVKRYLEQHPRTCKIVYMEDTNLAAMYAATVYPIYVVIDRDGYIAGTQRGAGGEEALRRLLARGGLELPDESDTE